jgi:hypothetical protein
MSCHIVWLERNNMNNVYNNGIDLSVTVNGRPTRIYTHEGRYFIESREGTEYVIEIANRNWYRVEAVVAVDGLSVMNGETASVEDSGYVIPAYGSLKVKGYRKNMEEVGAFKFTKKEASYAADKGDSSNVGIIAIAIWSEEVVLPSYCSNTITIGTGTPWTTYTTGTGTWSYGGTYTAGPVSDGLIGCPGTSGPQGSAGTASSSVFYTASNCSSGSAVGNSSSGVLRSMNSASFDHGTTWGQNVADKVGTTTFTRGKILTQTEIFYNSKENLESMGIKLVQEKLIALPQGFPRSFATPPKNWKG